MTNRHDGDSEDDGDSMMGMSDVSENDGPSPSSEPEEEDDGDVDIGAQGGVTRQRTRSSIDDSLYDDDASDDDYYRRDYNFTLSGLATSGSESRDKMTTSTRGGSDVLDAEEDGDARADAEISSLAHGVLDEEFGDAYADDAANGANENCIGDSANGNAPVEVVAASRQRKSRLSQRVATYSAMMRQDPTLGPSVPRASPTSSMEGEQKMRSINNDDHPQLLSREEGGGTAADHGDASSGSQTSPPTKQNCDVEIYRQVSGRHENIGGGQSDDPSASKSGDCLQSATPEAITTDEPESPDRGSLLSDIRRNLNGVDSPHASSPDKQHHAAAAASADADVVKLAEENRRLRERRRELLNLLSSTAQQFASYEKACGRKIHALEEKCRRLQSDAKLAPSSAESGSSTEELDGDAVTGDAIGSPGEGTQISHDSEEDVKSKDELIVQLKLRCEVLKQALNDKDGDIMQEKKAWEDEKEELLSKLDSASPIEGKGNHGELLSKKMESARLRRELDTALDDITTLTEALERNNVALDSAVMELGKLQKWKAEYGEAAAAVVPPPDAGSITDAEKLKGQLKVKEEETAQLTRDLESALDEIGQLKESIDQAAAAKGYGDFQNVVDNLKREASASGRDATLAKERAARLESELKSKVDEIDRLGIEVDKLRSEAEELAKGAQARGRNSEFEVLLKQRDLKIKSLDAMIHSYLKIIEKMKGDIERIDNEKEEAEFTATQKINVLSEQSESLKVQVKGYEKALDAFSQQSTLEPSRKDEEIVDDNMFMWDENDKRKSIDNGVFGEEKAAFVRSLNELEMHSSFQEDQIEKLKAELVRVRVKSEQERESSIAQLTAENDIVKAQRSALEEQLVAINKSAGVLRDSLPSGDAHPGENGMVGSNPVLLARVAMLEKENEVLESSVGALRSDNQSKLTPLLTRIALLEEEKRLSQEEMMAKLSRRDDTIANLESVLEKQLQQKTLVKKTPRNPFFKRTAAATNTQNSTAAEI